MSSVERATPGEAEAREEIRLLVARIVRVDVSELADFVRIRDELPIDSLMAMQIIATCENAFGICLDEAAVAQLPTVGDFVSLVARLRSEAGGIR